MQRRLHLTTVAIVALSACGAVLAQDKLSKLSKESKPITFEGGSDGVQCTIASNVTGGSCKVASNQGWNFTSDGFKLELGVPLPRQADAVKVKLPSFDLEEGKVYTLGFTGYGWPLAPFMINAVDPDGDVVQTQKAAMFAAWGDKFLTITPNTTGEYSFFLNGFGNNIIVMTNQKAYWLFDNITLYEGSPTLDEIKPTGDNSLISYAVAVGGDKTKPSDVSFSSVSSSRSG